ncbi:F0F1 ATP synthase subunit epsilon [bacterium]|nr:F0F1 ATP synthase subunit epsilon [bacterium]
MAKQFKLSLLTPNEPIFQGMVNSLVIPAEEGYWGILAMHMPSIIRLKKGRVRVKINGEEKEWEIKGGYAWVERDETALLVELSEKEQD